MNQISFSLYGRDQKYLHGAIRNTELARSFYPGWQCVFYCDNQVPSETRRVLVESGAQIIEGPSDLLNPMTWRFLPATEGEGRFISRDCDSRLNQRESESIAEWIASRLPFHVMRDHPHHKVAMMGGMWGAVCGSIKNLRSIILKPQWNKSGYSMDQSMLGTEIWPAIKDKCLQHDSCTASHFSGSKPFPSGLRLGDWRFVGEVFDANDTPRQNDWEMRVNHMAA